MFNLHVTRRFLRPASLTILGAVLLSIAQAALAGAISVTLTKAFNPTTIASGATTTLTFTLTNPPPNIAAQVIGFTDTLPAGLQLAANPNPQGNCTPSSGTVTPGGTTIVVTTATVPASTTNPGVCTLSVDVTNVPGQTGTCPLANFTNSSGNISGATLNLVNAVVESCVTVTAAPQADLIVLKDDSTTTVASGGTTTYTILVGNNGPAPADGAILTDPVAAGLAKTAAICAGTSGGAVCPLPANVTPALLEGGGVVIPTLPSGGLVLFTVTANVTASSGSVTNTANIAAPAGTTDPNLVNNSASDTDTVQAAALVPTLTKAFSLATITPGGSSTLTFTITNPAPNNPTQTFGFTDTLPAGLKIGTLPTSTTCGNVVGTAPAGGNVITVTSATVPASTAAASTCTLSVDVTNVAGQTGLCPNPSFTNGPTNVGNLSNLTNGVTAQCLSVTPPVAPTLTKAFSPTSISTGGTTTLTFTITNPAPNNPAQTFGFTDTLPAGLQIGTLPTLTTCTSVVGTAPAGGNVITITSATVPASTASPTTCTISVDVTNVSGQSGACPNASFTNGAANIGNLSNLTNGVTSQCVSVAAPQVPSLNKAFSPSTINGGGTSTLTFTITNPASNNPSQVVGFTDTLPTGIRVAATPNAGGTCTGGTVTAAAGSGSITVAGKTVSASTAAATTCTVTVDVTNVAGQLNASCVGNPAAFTNATGNIGGLSNLTNAVTPSCLVVNGFTFAISKTPNATNLLPNSPLAYDITVTNNGPSAANGSILTDPVIAGFSASGITCITATNGAVCPAPANVTLGNLQGGGIALPTFPASSTITFQLTGTVTQFGTIVNTATISTPAGVPLQTQSAAASVNVVVPPTVANIPTLSEYALFALALLLAIGGALRVQRTRRR